MGVVILAACATRAATPSMEGNRNARPVNSTVNAAAIDSLIAPYDRPGEPGLSVAVIQAGRIVYSRAVGLADVEARTRATLETNYRLASLTKQFTAMAIMMLVDDGALRYEDRLTDVLPGFPTYGNRVTIRHLLTHTSGLQAYEDFVSDTQTAQLHDRDVLATMTARDSTYFEPGTHFRYSNSGYAVLAMVVEAKSGMPFPRFLAERIFRPLGMTATVAHVEGMDVVTNRAYGYSRRGGRFVRTDQSSTSAVLGDGGIYSSVMDLVRWDAALDDERLVSRAAMRRAMTADTLVSGASAGYGFGWFVDEYNGRQRHWHYGETVGFRTGIHRFPRERLTVMVLANRADARPAEVAEKIADLTLR